MSTTTTIKVLQTVGITTSLLSAGALLAYNFFDIPVLKSQPASRSLPSIRWFFSRGSHLFPSAVVVSTSAFTCLAYNATLPVQGSGLSALQLMTYGRVPGYIAAALLASGVAIVTMTVMVPHPNFDIIRLNKELGGAASQGLKREQQRQDVSDEKLENSSGPPDVDGDFKASEFRDTTGPMGETDRQSTPEQDEKARELIERFRQLNMVRTLLMLGSGIVGLIVAL